MDAAEAKNYYLTRFSDLERALTNNGRSWTGEIRQTAMARFAALGFPTTGEEEWRYTSLAPITKVSFSPGCLEADDATREWIRSLALGSLEEHQLAFINGHFSAELSRLGRLPNGVIVGSLAAAMNDSKAKVEPYWARYADYNSHGLVALNTALMEDGAFLLVPQGAVVEAPIHLMFVATAPDGATVSHPRSLIVIGDRSQATVVESYMGFDGAVYFTNAVTEIVVGEGAVLDHTKIELESERAFHVATHETHIDRGGNLSSHSIALGGALARNDSNATLDGEGGECTLNGIYVAMGQQQVDNHTRIDHLKPHCSSRELYKGVMGGRSRAVFSGKIYVHKAAEKSDARQTNKNLLLSEDAWIDTKPQLEIYNNDVKCSHGSTIGQVDQDALFYLRSRGIESSAAVALLTRGFVSEITGRIKSVPAREWLEKILAPKLDLISADQSKL